MPLAIALMLMLTTGCQKKVQAPTDTTGSFAPPEKDTSTLVMLTEKRYYDRYGKLVGTNTYTYDDRGLLLTYEETDHREACTTNTFRYTYNEHGHLTSSTQESAYQESSRIIEYTYTYNEDGTIASYTTYVSDSPPSRTEYLEYDKQGRLLKITTDNDQGGRKDYIVCNYGSNGKPATITVSPYGVSIGTSSRDFDYIFSYDDRGNITSYEYTVDSFLIKLEYEYDDDGNLIRDEDKFEYIYVDGILCGLKYVESTNRKHFYTLDDTGHVTQLEYSDGTRIEYQYKTMELSHQELRMSRRYHSITYEARGIEAHLDDILYHYLPKPWQ